MKNPLSLKLARGLTERGHAFGSKCNPNKLFSQPGVKCYLRKRRRNNTLLLRLLVAKERIAHCVIKMYTSCKNWLLECCEMNSVGYILRLQANATVFSVTAATFSCPVRYSIAFVQLYCRKICFQIHSKQIIGRNKLSSGMQTTVFL